MIPECLDLYSKKNGIKMCVRVASLFFRKQAALFTLLSYPPPGKTRVYPPAIYAEYIGGIPMHLAVSMRGGTPLVLSVLSWYPPIIIYSLTLCSYAVLSALHWMRLALRCFA